MRELLGKDFVRLLCPDCEEGGKGESALARMAEQLDETAKKVSLISTTLGLSDIGGGGGGFNKPTYASKAGNGFSDKPLLLKQEQTIVGPSEMGWLEELPAAPPPSAAEPPPTHVHTIVIGNGPSGLSASAVLSGWRPYYDTRNPHPNRALHRRLSEEPERSILAHDLAALAAEGGPCEGGGWAGPALPRLYDALVRPDADLGHDHPSALRWAKDAAPVPHLVLGRGKAGGSWHDFAPYVYTLSLANWMNLPGPSMADWWGEKPPLAAEWARDLDMEKDRVPCCLVAAYFAAYPHLAGIADAQLPHTNVTAVEKIEPAVDGYSWLVTAENAALGRLEVRAKSVMMATGVGAPKAINVPGEAACDRLVSNLGELDRALAASAEPLRDPILVVGHGLTAADVVFASLIKLLPVPTQHAFRIPAKEVRRTMLGRLSAAKYPDYHLVSRLIQGRAQDSFYTPIPSSRLRAFTERSDGRWEAELVLADGSVRREPFSFCVVSVGSEAELPAMRGFALAKPGARPDAKANALPVQPDSYRALTQDSLYVLGPLSGEKFVRFAVGAAVAAARDALQSTGSL